MIYNINTAIATAPKIPRKLDIVKAALLLGVDSCPAPAVVVVVCWPPPAGVDGGAAEIATDWIIVQNVGLSWTTVALLKKTYLYWIMKIVQGTM
jgi:hypothetical protein